MISHDGVISIDNTENERVYDEVLGWLHQCWQVYSLEKTIDLDEFKRRLNVDNIDYKKFMTDHSDRLNAESGLEKVYVQRVLHVLYPEEYTDPDQG